MEKNISISQQNLNFIIDRCKGDRINLKMNYLKLKSYSKFKKNINF